MFCFVIHKAESSLLSDVKEQVARFELGRELERTEEGHWQQIELDYD